MYRHLVRTLIERNCPRPQRRTSGELDDLAVAPNPAYRGLLPASSNEREAAYTNGRILKPLTDAVSVSYLVDALSLSLAILQIPAVEPVRHFTVTRWLRNIGDYVHINDALAEVADEIGQRSIPSPVSGILLKFFITEGQFVNKGDRLAVISIDEDARQLKPTEAMLLTELGVPDDREELPPVAHATVTMPALGDSVTEGTVTRWLKRVGEPIDIDDHSSKYPPTKSTPKFPHPSPKSSLTSPSTKTKPFWSAPNSASSTPL